MTRIGSTKVLWRVQVRKSRAHKWVNKGLFEVRSGARIVAADLRRGESYMHWEPAYGFGNTRVIRHISGKGRA